jgi:uncharacterized protein YjgD (DUF1641 family)
MTNQDTQAGTMRLIQAAQESLTDSMVERLSTTGANALEVVDRLNDEDTRDAVNFLIDKVTELHRSGALSTMFDLLILLHGARNALTDSMVERLFVFSEHMINNLATEELATLAGDATDAMHEAAEETADKKSTGGLMATIRMLSQPETQNALQFLMAFACKMRGRYE